MIGLDRGVREGGEPHRAAGEDDEVAGGGAEGARRSRGRCGARGMK